MTIELIGAGIVSASVCAPEDMPPEQVTEELNRLYPTGISSRWRLDSAPAFKGGEPNPGPCEQRKQRTHYLFHC